MQEAINQAKDGDEIVQLADIEEGSNLSLKTGEKYHLEYEWSYI
ncbi:MAG: hypothetical protein ACLRQF_16445 [Thomasclavelia ramosa]